jgi:hypothetical protein
MDGVTMTIKNKSHHLLIITGTVGAVLAAVCCATPLLAVLFAGHDSSAAVRERDSVKMILDRRILLSAWALLPAPRSTSVPAQVHALPSWNEGQTQTSITDFVALTPQRPTNGPWSI